MMQLFIPRIINLNIAGDVLGGVLLDSFVERLVVFLLMARHIELVVLLGGFFAYIKYTAGLFIFEHRLVACRIDLLEVPIQGSFPPRGWW